MGEDLTQRREGTKGTKGELKILYCFVFFVCLAPLCEKNWELS